jgi:hypothetical protein
LNSTAYGTPYSITLNIAINAHILECAHARTLGFL